MSKEGHWPNMELNKILAYIQERLRLRAIDRLEPHPGGLCEGQLVRFGEDLWVVTFARFYEQEIKLVSLGDGCTTIKIWPSGTKDGWVRSEFRHESDGWEPPVVLGKATFRLRPNAELSSYDLTEVVRWGR